MIYKKLKNLTCTDVPSDVLPRKEWNGKWITINPQAFQELVKNKSILFKDVLSNHNLKSLEQLFTNLDLRLSKSQNLATREKIIEISGESYEVLKEN